MWIFFRSLEDCSSCFISVSSGESGWDLCNLPDWRDCYCCSVSKFNSLWTHELQHARRLKCYHRHIWDYWYFSWQFWFRFVLHPAWHSRDILCMEVKLAGWQYTALTYSFSYLEPVHCFMSSSKCVCIQPWHTPFPIWNQSIVPSPVLNVYASWPAYTFLGRQVRWSGIHMPQGS